MTTFSKFTKTLISATALAGVLAVFPLASVSTDRAYAAEEESKYANRKTRKTPALREKVYKVLGKAQEFADAENWVEANKVLEDGLGQKLDSLNSYERAQYYNFKGFLAYSQEKYNEAIAAYQNVLRQENLPPAMEDNMIYTLAQLYFVKEDYQKSIDYMNRWMEYQEAPSEQALILLGQAYYALGDKKNDLSYYRKGIPYIEQAISLYEEKGKEPKENWYLLLRVMYFELKEYQKVTDILELLVTKWPKKEYWIQLAGMYGELTNEPGLSAAEKKELEKKQLTVYELAHRQGLLEKNSELVNMSQLFLYHEIPYKAAKVLAEGLKKGLVEQNKKNWEYLSQAYINSQEMRKALEPLKKAAEMSGDGNLYMRLGQVYMQLDDYENATKYIGLALDKGGLKRPDTAHVVRGMAYFNMGELEKARQEFVKAKKYDRSRNMANKWISYLSKEAKRLADIKEFLGEDKRKK
ncbi:tetratricopeptide repeat protein [Luteithermobacter gelatinilyticus]|uniref:tetratricopeptide repeat protein n=1 Tax=Luteithermobacter gelatinilyticus TaxID=2582913 RepID=UPI001106709A|nr:tetratricopeptide repeat protein [Luteithermobacter gelatinilyticus]